MSETLQPVAQHWKEDSLGNLCHFVMGQSPPSSTYNNKGLGMPFLQGKADFGDVYPTPSVFCTAPLKIAPANSVLISVRAPVGDVNVADREFIIGRGLAAIQFLDGDNAFLFFLMQKNCEKIRALGSGTTFQSINKATLEQFSVRVPPLPEQRAIAHVLQTVQKAKEARQRELVLERERKAALMEHLFTHGTRGESTKKTEIGNIPESWDVLPMAKVATIERGKFAHRPRNDPAYYGGTTPFVQTGDVTASDGHITKYFQTLNEQRLSVSKIFPKGTILITIAANIGFSAILEFDSAFPDSLIGITPNECIDAEFLNYYLMTQQPEMDRKAPRGTQKNINIEFLTPWQVPVPSLDEQRCIASALRASDRKSKSLRQETALLMELFDAMLKDLMTGTISASPPVEKAQ